MSLFWFKVNSIVESWETNKAQYPFVRRFLREFSVQCNDNEFKDSSHNVTVCLIREAATFN